MIFEVLISTESSIEKHTKTHGKLEGFRFPHLICKPTAHSVTYRMLS